MTALASLLGGAGQQVWHGPLVERFRIGDPNDPPAPVDSPEMSRRLTIGLRAGPQSGESLNIERLKVSVLVPSSPQTGFSPRGARIQSARIVSDLSERGDRLERHAQANASPVSLTWSRIEDERLPYIAMIRAMLDLDQIAAARALLSVALAESPASPELLRTAHILAVPKATRRAVRDSDRQREYAWLAAHAHAYRGRWVAIVGSDLLASAASLTELLELLKPSGAQRLALVHRID